MPLLDLKTDLKSLKYGNDQPGGGSSGQPYVTTDISTVGTFTRFDDGLIRGGFIGATAASAVDTIRIGKFLKDFPKGPLFITKQIGLQFSNPRLETKKLSAGAGFLDNSISLVKDNLGFQPTRIYNLGINTLAQIPVNAFGGHFNRHGLLPVQDEQTKYLAVAQYNNIQQGGKNNRLVLLANKFNLGNNNTISLNAKETKTLLSTLFTAGELATDILFNDILQPIRTSKIDDYSGGSNSVYGLGRTLIKRYNYSRTATQANEDKRNPYRIINDINYRNDLGIGSNSISNYDPNAISTEENIIKEGINLNTVNYTSSNKTYIDLLKQINNQKFKERLTANETNPTSSNAFGIYDNENDPEGSLSRLTLANNDGTLIGFGPVYPGSTKNPVYTNGKYYVKINKAWNEVYREKRVGSGLQDIINLTPIFESIAGNNIDTVTIPGVGERNIKDLVPFRIQALNGNDPTQVENMVFRAYITQFVDNTDPIWNPVRYVGRGEEFYVYNGFTRKIQISFKAAALSAEEMEPMYQKLNYLVGNVMPDYTEDGLMRGPMIKMTVGNWICEQDGILTSIGYSIPIESPWEIAINGVNEDKLLILPHIVEVNLGFTPIGSQTNNINKISSKDLITSHIAQNQNGYQYIK